MLSGGRRALGSGGWDGWHRTDKPYLCRQLGACRRGGRRLYSCWRRSNLASRPGAECLVLGRPLEAGDKGRDRSCGCCHSGGWLRDRRRRTRAANTKLTSQSHGRHVLEQFSAETHASWNPLQRLLPVVHSAAPEGVGVLKTRLGEELGLRGRDWDRKGEGPPLAPYLRRRSAILGGEGTLSTSSAGSLGGAACTGGA